MRIDKKEVCKKAAKEIIQKLDEIADICKDNDIDCVSWIDISAGWDGYINFRMGGYEFTRSDRNGKLTIKFEEDV